LGGQKLGLKGVCAGLTGGGHLFGQKKRKGKAKNKTAATPQKESGHTRERRQNVGGKWVAEARGGGARAVYRGGRHKTGNKVGGGGEK